MKIYFWTFVDLFYDCHGRIFIEHKSREVIIIIVIKTIVPGILLWKSSTIP